MSAWCTLAGWSHPRAPRSIFALLVLTTTTHAQSVIFTYDQWERLPTAIAFMKSRRLIAPPRLRRSHRNGKIEWLGVPCPLWAKSGLMQCSAKNRHPITSSARARNVGAAPCPCTSQSTHGPGYSAARFAGGNCTVLAAQANSRHLHGALH